MIQTRRCGSGGAPTPRIIRAADSGRAYHDARGEGWVVNHKKIQRLWRDEGLRVPRRRRRKRHGTSTTADAATADEPDRVWAADFQFDATRDGRPIKIIAELTRLAANRGTYRTVLRCDNGPESAWAAMAHWAHGHVGVHQPTTLPPVPTDERLSRLSPL
jgi:putative transposase